MAMVECPITMLNPDALEGHAVGVPWIIPEEHRMVFATGRMVAAAEVVDEHHVRLWLRDGGGKRTA
jgi:hypothetical protein